MASPIDLRDGLLPEKSDHTDEEASPNPSAMAMGAAPDVQPQLHHRRTSNNTSSTSNNPPLPSMIPITISKGSSSGLVHDTTPKDNRAGSRTSLQDGQDPRTFAGDSALPPMHPELQHSRTSSTSAGGRFGRRRMTVHGRYV